VRRWGNVDRLLADLCEASRDHVIDERRVEIVRATSSLKPLQQVDRMEMARAPPAFPRPEAVRSVSTITAVVMVLSLCKRLRNRWGETVRPCPAAARTGSREFLEHPANPN